jgi:hypothetical protein
VHFERNFEDLIRETCWGFGGAVECGGEIRDGEEVSINPPAYVHTCNTAIPNGCDIASVRQV